jgi:hypothetical protein
MTNIDLDAPEFAGGYVLGANEAGETVAVPAGVITDDATVTQAAPADEAQISAAAPSMELPVIQASEISRQE